MISNLKVVRYFARNANKIHKKLLDSLPQDIMPEGFNKQKLLQRLKQLEKDNEGRNDQKNADLTSQFGKRMRKQNTSFPNADKKKVDQDNTEKIMRMLKSGKSQENIKKAIKGKDQIEKEKAIKMELEKIFERQDYDQQTQVIKASQDLILGGITSKSKRQQINIDGKTKQETNIINRYKADKLMNQIENSNKIQLAEQDFIEAKYSPQIIQKAKAYKSKQLGQMKQLIGLGSQQRLTKEKHLRPLKDKAKNQQRARQLKALKLSKIEQQTMLKQNKNFEKATRKQLQGLTEFQDAQTIKEKGIKQFIESQNITKEDKLILDEGQRDMKKASKMQDIFLQQYDKDDPIIKKYYQTDKQQIYNQSSFGKQQLRIKNLTNRMQKMGIDVDIQQIKQIDRQVLFDQKKFREEEEAFQRATIKRQKRKLMKKQLKAIHQENLRADLDYEQPTKPGFKMKKEDLKDETKNPELEYQIAQQMLQKKKGTITEKDIKWNIHRTKTFKRIQAIIQNFFMSLKSQNKEPILSQIQINAIEHNDALTVIHIFWSFNSRRNRNIQYNPASQVQAEPQDMNQKQMSQNQLKMAPKIQDYLTNKSSFLGGRVTQILGLRYAPEIRFYYDEIVQKAQQMLKDMIKHKKQIVQSQLEDYKKKGLVKTQEDEVIYRKKLETIANQRLKDFNSRRSLLSKGYKNEVKKLNKKLQQKNSDKKKVSGPKKAQSKKKKRQKYFSDEEDDNQTLQEFISKREKSKTSSQKFWQVIDKY